MNLTPLSYSHGTDNENFCYFPLEKIMKTFVISPLLLSKLIEFCHTYLRFRIRDLYKKLFLHFLSTHNRIARYRNIPSENTVFNKFEISEILIIG